MEAHQAGCVAIGGRALLIEGSSGVGKSSLALALIDRGAVLVGDDGVMIEASGSHLLVHPHPETRGLLEVRNLGIVEMPVCDKAEAALLLRLDEAAPRYVEEPENVVLAGIALPMLRLWPRGPALPLKAELALQKFGTGKR